MTNEEDDKIKNHSSEDDILAHHLPSIAEEEDYDMEEYWPTGPLNNNFWMKEPVSEGHLCIHENAQHYQCPYPCPYGLNQQNHTQEDVMQYIDLHDIFDFPDVMLCANDADISSLEDSLEL